MTLFDIAVLLILVTSVVVSLLRGLVKEILSLASWVLAFFVASAASSGLAVCFPFGDESMRLIAAFITLFIAVHLLMWVVSLAADGVIRAMGLKLVDRGLGSVFGLLRGVIIVLALMLVCGITSLPQQPFWKNAMLRPSAEAIALAVKPYLPGQFAQYVKF